MGQKIAYSCLVFMVLAWGSKLQAQVDIQASIDTNNLRIGEQFHYSIYAKHPVNQVISFPIFLDTLAGLDVVEKMPIDSNENNGVVEEILSYTLTAFDSGLYQIPPLAVGVSNGDTVYTELLAVAYRSVEVDTTVAFKPIKYPTEVPITLGEILPLLGIALGIVAIVLLIMYFFVWNKKEKVVESIPKPKIPAHEIAMRKLSELEAKKLWQQGDIKEYYVELTNIIRAYLEDRYDILALESTTDELISYLGTKDIDIKQKVKLKDILQRADLAKFAKFKPEASFNMASMEMSRELIRKTKVSSNSENVETVNLNEEEALVKESKPE